MALGGLAVGVLLLSACAGQGSPKAAPTPIISSTTSSPTPTAPSKPPKPPQPPPSRACYRMGYADAVAPTNTRKPSPCTADHTAVTFYVGTYRASLPVDGKQVHGLEAKVCPQRFAAFVGGTADDRRLSMLRTVWFTPSVEQASLGAHWFECVAIALHGDQALAVLHTKVQGALDQTAGQDAYGICGTAEPGTTGFEQRICSAPHTWRALRTVDFAAGPYPGEASVKADGQQPCQDAGRAASSNPLHYQWSYQWPSLAQWRAGQTYGVCWAPA